MEYFNKVDKQEVHGSTAHFHRLVDFVNVNVHLLLVLLKMTGGILQLTALTLIRIQILSVL